jgi:DNA polymerase-3 subunit delta'
MALLPTVLAQPTAIATLERALASGRVHHAYLFDGPEGVGKERAAFGLAQALVCERRAEGEARACGNCSACARAVPRTGERTAVHPDVAVLERGLYEPAQIGRRSPEVQDISIDQVRALVLARAAFPPHEGRAKVTIVRRAEELSTSAANALLKTLEEPRPRTHFVLLSSQPDTLLPTIRSRTLRVRFGPLPDEVVAKLLSERSKEAGASTHDFHTVAQLAGGSMQNALALGDEDASRAREEFVSRAIAAIEARDIVPALELAENAKKISKDVLIEQLAAFAAAIATRARQAVLQDSVAAETETRRHRYALAAARQLDANASPQLAIESMLLHMRTA